MILDNHLNLIVEWLWKKKLSKKRRVFTDATKFKIVIEAIKGQRQISEIASDYEVHPNQ